MSKFPEMCTAWMCTSGELFTDRAVAERRQKWLDFSTEYEDEPLYGRSGGRVGPDELLEWALANKALFNQLKDLAL